MPASDSGGGMLSDPDGAAYYAPPDDSAPAYSGPERRGGGALHSGPERRRTTPDYGAPRSGGAGVPPVSPGGVGGSAGGTGSTASTQRGGPRLGMAQTETRTSMGLTSRSALNYPEAYAPVSREMWAGLTDEQRDAVMCTQAIAQEKVGFERTAPKYFIQDFDPSNPNAPAGSGAGSRARQSDADLLSIAAPRLVVGGMLLGASILALVLVLSKVLPMLPIGPAAAVGLAVGLMLVFMARS